ncbi:unnamed protein product, partial [Polarella glacialis]
REPVAAHSRTNEAWWPPRGMSQPGLGDPLELDASDEDEEYEAAWDENLRGLKAELLGCSMDSANDMRLLECSDSASGYLDGTYSGHGGTQSMLEQTQAPAFLSSYLAKSRELLQGELLDGTGQQRQQENWWEEEPSASEAGAWEPPGEALRRGAGASLPGRWRRAGGGGAHAAEALLSLDERGEGSRGSSSSSFRQRHDFLGAAAAAAGKGFGGRSGAVRDCGVQCESWREEELSSSSSSSHSGRHPNNHRPNNNQPNNNNNNNNNDQPPHWNGNARHGATAIHREPVTANVNNNQQQERQQQQQQQRQQQQQQQQRQRQQRQQAPDQWWEHLPESPPRRRRAPGWGLEGAEEDAEPRSRPQGA